MKNKLFIAIIFLPVLLASKCKKDYYTGTENVRLRATLNNTNETIFLGDTLKIKLTIPTSFTSESGQTVNVNSVQNGQYSFVFYKIDTVTKIGTRIITSSNISVSKGSIDSYLGNVFVYTTNTPYESILNIIPPSKGIYYVQVTSGSNLKVNNSYESFMKVNFDVIDIHNSMMSYYLNPAFGNSMVSSQNDGIGIYAFRVN